MRHKASFYASLEVGCSHLLGQHHTDWAASPALDLFSKEILFPSSEISSLIRNQWETIIMKQTILLPPDSKLFASVSLVCLLFVKKEGSPTTQWRWLESVVPVPC